MAVLSGTGQKRSAPLHAAQVSLLLKRRTGRERKTKGQGSLGHALFKRIRRVNIKTTQNSMHKVVQLHDFFPQ